MPSYTPLRHEARAKRHYYYQGLSGIYPIACRPALTPPAYGPHWPPDIRLHLTTTDVTEVTCQRCLQKAATLCPMDFSEQVHQFLTTHTPPTLPAKQRRTLTAEILDLLAACWQ